MSVTFASLSRVPPEPFSSLLKILYFPCYSCFHFDAESNVVKVAPRTLPG